jgi:hypothetical protein
MNESRSPTMRLGVGIYLTQRQPPPWHDEWSIKMDETSLTQLSAELLSLPDELLRRCPRLHQLRRLTEKAVTSGHGEWEHGLHPATLAEDEAWDGSWGKSAAEILRERGELPS